MLSRPRLGGGRITKTSGPRKHGTQRSSPLLISRGLRPAHSISLFGEVAARRSPMTFTLWFDEICTHPARAVLEAIQKAEKIRLGDLRIYDLLRDGDRPL